MKKETLNHKPNFLLRKRAKLTYSNVEFQNFLGKTPGAPLTWEGKRGKGTGRAGKGEEWREERDIWPFGRKILSTPWS